MPRPVTEWSGADRPGSGWEPGPGRVPPPDTSVRDTAAEFATPRHLVERLSLARRPDAISMDYQTAHTLGPATRSDASEGLTVRVWKVRHEVTPGGGRVWLAGATAANDGYEPEVELFSYLGDPIMELDCAFDQSGAPIVVAERAGQLWIYWYDPILEAQDFALFGPGRTPRCLLDDPDDSASSDVVIAYVNDAVNAVCVRQQRDRYAVESLTPITGGAVLSAEVTLPPIAQVYVEDVVLGSSRRLILTVSYHEGTRYHLLQLATTLYPVTTQEPFGLAETIADGDINTIVTEATPADDGVTLAEALEAGALQSLILIVAPDESDLIPGESLAAWNDAEGATLGETIEDGMLSDPFILHTSYDGQDFAAPVTIIAGSMVVVVIEHTSYDAQDFQPAVTIVAGSLAA